MASVHITSLNHRGENVTKILQDEEMLFIAGGISANGDKHPWLLGVNEGSERVTVKLSDSEVEEIVFRYNEEIAVRKKNLEYAASR